MNIGIVDADLIGKNKKRFPNLACMKISGYYNEQGATTELITDYNNVDKYDHVFISKVFTDTEVPEDVLILDNVSYGGTGFFYDKAEPLPLEIEHSFPNYHLYDEWVSSTKLSKASKSYFQDYSIGFTTRGCIRQCSFCVNRNYKKCNMHSSLDEFVDINRKYIMLLDDNVLACKDWEAVFDSLNNTGKRFRYQQGMDERLLTDKKCQVLFNSNWIGDYIFAFDNIKDKDLIIRKLDLIRKYYNGTGLKFYTFTGFNHSSPDNYDDEFWKQDIINLIERIVILRKYGCFPYIMRYKDYELSPYKGMYIELARWCNQPGLFRNKTFYEFCMAGGQNKVTKERFIEYSEVFDLQRLECGFFE